jgi:hypothetical protein
MNHEWRFLRENRFSNSEFYCIHCLKICRLLETKLDGLTREQIKLMECVANER